MAEDYSSTKEKAWVSSLGERIGNAAVAVVEADSLAKDHQVRRVIELVDRGNIDFRSNTGLVGMEQQLETGISVPVISVVRSDALVVDNATIDLSLEVTESANDTTTAKVGSETQASASYNSLIVKGSVKQTVRASVEHTRARKSDYTSKMSVHVSMSQSEPAEGMALVLDALMSPIKAAADINKQLVERQGEALTAQTAQAESLPEVEDKNGGNGGGGSSE